MIGLTAEGAMQVVIITLFIAFPIATIGSLLIRGLYIRNPPANRIDGGTPRGQRALASLGFTGPAMPGDVIYASLEAVRETVRAAQLEKWPPGFRERLAARLLGRAIAHEVGHYLLRSKDHSSKGLMRASFGVGDLMARDLEDFRLEPEQVAALSVWTPLRQIAQAHTASAR